MFEMIIRKAEQKDFEQILKVYEIAREYMRNNGNPNQWGTDKPKIEILKDDISKGQLFVGENDKGDIHFVFAFILGEDPTYSYIDGEWISDKPYGTIHRIASDGTISGVVKSVVEYGKRIVSNIRIDTHNDNKTMRHVVKKLGFVECGIIYLEDGAPRIAYQLVIEE